MGQIIGNSGTLGPPQVMLSGFCELDPHTHPHFQSVGRELCNQGEYKSSSADSLPVSNKEAWLSFNT